MQATHPNNLNPSLSIEQVISQIETITTLFHVADETPDVTRQLLTLLKNYPTRGKQVHDANLIATMLAYNIDTLITLNIADFKRFESIITLISIDDIRD